MPTVVDLCVRTSGRRGLTYRLTWFYLPAVQIDILQTGIILTFEPPTPTLPCWEREHKEGTDYTLSQHIHENPDMVVYCELA